MMGAVGEVSEVSDTRTYFFFSLLARALLHLSLTSLTERKRVQYRITDFTDFADRWGSWRRRR